jgi:broad specificity phosphatase PhoE
VSHGGPLRALLCSLLGMPLEQQWQLRLDPGSLSAIDLLPTREPPVLGAILVLLNAQRPTRAAHPSKEGFDHHKSSKGNTGRVSF